MELLLLVHLSHHFNMIVSYFFMPGCVNVNVTFKATAFFYLSFVLTDQLCNQNENTFSCFILPRILEKMRLSNPL